MNNRQDQHEVFTCKVCNQDFCSNFSQPMSVLNILKHIRETQHSVFSLPNKTILQCSFCQAKNLISLYQDTDQIFFCREHKNDECVPVIQYKKQFIEDISLKNHHPPTKSLTELDNKQLSDNNSIDNQLSNNSNIIICETCIQHLMNSFLQFECVFYVEQFLSNCKQGINCKKLLAKIEFLYGILQSVVNLLNPDQVKNDLQLKIDGIVPHAMSCYTRYIQIYNPSTGLKKEKQVNSKTSNRKSYIQQQAIKKNNFTCEKNYNKMVKEIELIIKEFLSLSETEKFQVVYKISQDIQQITLSLVFQFHSIQKFKCNYIQQSLTMNIMMQSFAEERNRLIAIIDDKISKGEIFDEITQYNINKYKLPEIVFDL